MDAMYTDSYEVDHLTSCGCDDSGVTFDPSGELAPPLPPVDFDVQPDSSFDVMAPGQPGSTDVSYDVAPEFTPDVTTIPTPDTLPPAPSCGPETEVAPDLTTIPVPDAPPAPFGSVEGEGSFDVTGLGQPGSTDGSIDVIGLGQPGNTDVGPDASIDVIGLGQPGNDAPVAPEPTISYDGGQPLDEPLVITDAAPAVGPYFEPTTMGTGFVLGDAVHVDAPSEAIVGGFVLGDAVHVDAPSEAVVGGYLLDQSGMGSSPVPGLYNLFNMVDDPITKIQILGMINSQNHMTDVWLSDFTASII